MGSATLIYKALYIYSISTVVLNDPYRFNAFFCEYNNNNFY